MTAALASAPFPSRYNGKCKSLACLYSGVIRRAQMIRWDSTQPGLVWHDACPAPVAGSAAATVPVQPATSRGQGPMFDAADAAEFEATAQPVVTPPTPINGQSTSGSRRSDSPNPTGQSHDFLAGLADALTPYLDERLQGLTDEDQVRDIIEGVLKGAILKTVTTVTVTTSNGDAVTSESRDMGLQHCQFPLLLKACQARTADGFRLNVWLTGPAGSGKTTAAKNCAKALSLPYRFTGSIDTEYKLMGFIDAQGRIVNTQFRQAYEFGGVFLFDEVDSSLPAALLAFNAALANGEAAFPDAIVPRHADFICIAAANTWGLGANSDYVGRMKLDAAFLDRFVQVAWSVDEGLEAATVGNSAWVERVQKLRKAAASKGIKAIISPRASYFGASLLATGMDQALVETLTVRKAMSTEQWGAICA